MPTRRRASRPAAPQTTSSRVPTDRQATRPAASSAAETGKRFHRIERAYGRFERRLALPTEVDPTKVAAEFKDGVLKIHLPKSATARAQAVDVKVA